MSPELTLTWDKWSARWDAALRACRNLNGDSRELVIRGPAGARRIVEAQRYLEVPLPEEFRRVLTEFSAEVCLRWFFPRDFRMPEPFQEIFSGECSWSLDRLLEMEDNRKEWVRCCFPNPKDPYDRVWHEKLAFLEVGNGDLLALDNAKSPAPVVYLSHEGDDFNGVELGANFIDFIERSTLLGCVGPECWQVSSFLTATASYLDPYGPNATRWRGVFGLNLPPADSSD